MGMMSGTPWAGMSKWSVLCAALTLVPYSLTFLAILMVALSFGRHPVYLAWNLLTIFGWLPISLLLILMKPFDNLLLAVFFAPISSFIALSLLLSGSAAGFKVTPEFISTVYWETTIGGIVGLLIGYAYVLFRLQVDDRLTQVLYALPLMSFGIALWHIPRFVVSH